MFENEYNFVKEKFKEVFTIQENQVTQFVKAEDEIKQRLKLLLSGIVNESLSDSQDIQRYLFDISNTNEKAFLYFASNILKESFFSYSISNTLESLPDLVKIDDIDTASAEFLKYAKDVMCRFEERKFCIGLEYPFEYCSISKEKAQYFYSYIQMAITMEAIQRKGHIDFPTLTLMLFFGFNLCKFSGYPLASFFSISTTFIQCLIDDDQLQNARDTAEQLFNVSIANGVGFFWFIYKNDMLHS